MEDLASTRKEVEIKIDWFGRGEGEDDASFYAVNDVGEVAHAGDVGRL